MTRVRAHLRARDHGRATEIVAHTHRRGTPKCPCGCGQRGLCEPHKERLREISQKHNLRYERPPSNRRKDGRV